MQLKKAIFLWVSLATLVPLTILVLAATVYSQRIYEEELGREIYASLNSVVSEIDRRLSFEREMLLGLVDAPAIQQFYPVLQSASRGDIHPDFSPRSSTINSFLGDFQEIVTSLNTIRLLDINGNTLIKVRGGQYSPAYFDGIESFPYAEEELDDETFINRLKEIPANEVSVVLLSQNREEQGEDSSLPMMDYIIPLAYPSGAGEIIGYITANIRGKQIDRILDFAPRLQNGKLLIAEFNPEQPDRDGLILYDDKHRMRFSDIKLTNRRLQDEMDGKIWEAVQNGQEGILRAEPEGQIIYFIEYQPYPNLLAHWVVATRIDKQQVTGPFEDIRLAIGIFAGSALLLGLWFTGFSAARIARPVTRLVYGMRDYAHGDFDTRVSPQGSDEIKQLGLTFNEMADTLDHARDERDKAQDMMLQNAKLASIGQLAAGIGHEINNPLGNILSYAKLLERGLGDKDQRLLADVTSLREEALRASQIIRGILNFARQVPPKLSHFELQPWLDETLTLVRQSAKEQSVELEVGQVDDYTLEADRSQLQQALVNLLLNAICASTPDGWVITSIERVGRDIVISVQDSGGGIDNGDLGKIFDPFYSSKPEGKGTGLGLSISLGIVERHGGKLEVENNAEGGVIARIIVPLSQFKDDA
ncbi:MAG: hypothetical protein BMS9Abin26_2068 [Gammaproteobacteria bacterium]|nr:MAG: hypothetical protein BMS9Abin26_2068 [Gammaproteobacteria bacterium]